MTVDQYIQASVSLLLDIRNNTRPEGTPAISLVDLFPASPGIAAGAPSEAADKPATAKRGRGRPVAGETAAPAAQTAPATAPAATEADPFADPTTAATAAPTATLDEVRAALKGLAAVTDQATALGVLKSTAGVDNLTELQKTPAKYGKVVAAAKAMTPAPAAAAEADDPFGETAAPAVAEETFSLEQVKALVVETQKRTSAAAAQKVVMDLGGTAPGPGGVPGPSLKALPVANYAKVVAGLKALPSTK